MDKEKTSSQWAVLKKLVSYLWHYKWMTLVALAFLMLTTIVQSYIPLVARDIIDRFSKGVAWHEIASYYGLFIVQMISLYIGNYLFSKVSFSIVYDIRNDVYSHIQKLGMSYFDRTPVGSVVSRISNDTESMVNMFTGVLTSFIRSIFILTTTLYTMLILNAQLTGVIILFLPLIFLLVYIYRKLSFDVISQTRRLLSDINVKLSQTIEGMHIIQAFRQEERQIEEFEAINEEHLKYMYKFMQVDSLWLRPALSLLKLLAYALLMTYFGLSWESIGLTAGLMYAFIQYVNRLFDPLIQLAQNFSTLQSSMVSAGRVFDMMELDEFEPIQDETSALRIEDGNVAFENVSFSYDDEHKVLDNVSFSVAKGETIAFVGHTGSGKSSIINLFMRFYEFNQGRITIDGKDIKEYSSDELRKNIGLVLQESFLYHGTIESNIQMYQSLTRDQIEEAAKFVDADDFIKQLPKGYDEPVSERGSTLSSGQRQLLAFARVIAANPKILILDEATANIDSETEEVIQNSLRKMRQGRTTIAIAHRLSTIQDAQCIYVLDKGRIIEAGTHEELIAKKGTYYTMYQLQAGMMQA